MLGFYHAWGDVTHAMAQDSQLTLSNFQFKSDSVSCYHMVGMERNIISDSESCLVSVLCHNFVLPSKFYRRIPRSTSNVNSWLPTISASCSGHCSGTDQSLKTPKSMTLLKLCWLSLPLTSQSSTVDDMIDIDPSQYLWKIRQQFAHKCHAIMPLWFAFWLLVMTYKVGVWVCILPH